jgi:hypothetical protein
MLWWLVGLWPLSPTLVPIFQLLPLVQEQVVPGSNYWHRSAAIDRCAAPGRMTIDAGHQFARSALTAFHFQAC